MELKEIHSLAADLAKQFKTSPDPYKALATVVEETGEVATEINRLYKSESKTFQGKETDFAKLQEEVGDLLLSVFHLADVLKIDLEREMSDKDSRIRKKFGLRSGK